MNVVDVEEKSENTFPDWPNAGDFIARHQLGVWRYLRAIGCDASLADDLTQDTFYAVLRRPFEFVGDAAAAGYLRRVAYHLLVTARKRGSRVLVTDATEALESNWARWVGFDNGDRALDALNECMERLTERARLSLRMRFADDASRESIAEALGITEHGAKNLMQRAKQQLRDCIESKL
jgi:RNA polymerase sigma-70 factor (ECF subfamily)